MARGSALFVVYCAYSILMICLLALAIFLTELHQSYQSSLFSVYIRQIDNQVRIGRHRSYSDKNDRVTLLTVDSKTSIPEGVAKDCPNFTSEIEIDNGVTTANVAHPHPFRYILNNPNVCRDLDIYLLIYVHTAPDHFKRRSLIRETWGAVLNYDVNVRTIFILGRMTNHLKGRIINDAIKLESDLYNDIVQEDFIDSYHNLTYKAVAGVRWIDEQCSHARWILKIDDDTFVNIFNLLRYLHCLDRHEAVDKSISNAGYSTHSEEEKNVTGFTRNIFLCLVWEYGTMPVQRHGKWKVSEADWPEKFYPSYCSGMAFVMSTNAAVALHRASYGVPFFWVDDVFLTGLIARTLGPAAIRHVQYGYSYTITDMSPRGMDTSDAIERFTGPQWYQHVFWYSGRTDTVGVMRSLWRSVVRIEYNKPTGWRRPTNRSHWIVSC